MNTLKLIRNNWKKSVLLSCVAGYGFSTLKMNIEIKRYMNEVSREVLNKYQNTEIYPKKILVVMNPIANKKRAENLFKKYCEPILHLAGFSVEILRTSHIGHAKTFIEEMSILPDVIVVAGGDGTRSEVLTGLLRRPGDQCPLAFLPLGSVTYSNFSNYSLNSKNEVDYVKSVCTALMPLLKSEYRYTDVIQYDVIDEDSNEGSSNLKPIYGLNGFSWGLLKDIECLKEKYWYLGPLKHHFAAFVRSFSGTSNWDSATDYVYTPPCRGCSNCCSETKHQPNTGFFLTNFVKTQNINRETAQKQVKNEKCANKLYGFIKPNQINIKLSQNDEHFTELESRFINTLKPGWDFITKIPKITKRNVEPNLTLKCRTIRLYPFVESNPIFYSIDGEEYEPRPIKVSIVPNAIKVFC